MDSTDGCSGGVTWFYKAILRREPPFGFCCDEHDLAYTEGGDWWNRWIADWRLAVCLWESKRQCKAILFWLLVRACGWLPQFWAGQGRQLPPEMRG